MVHPILSAISLRILIKAGFFAFMVFLFGDLNAQIYVSNYSFLGVAIGTESTKPVNFEARLSTNNKVGATTVELAALYHLSDAPYHSISAGLAFNIDPFGEQNVAIVVPVELEVFPAPNFKRIALAFELGPEFQLSLNEVNLRHIWAIRYYFSDPG